MSEKKRKILGHVFSYAGSQYFAQFTGFFTAVFMRRFLGPFNMGLWSLLRVITDYASYAHLGTTSTVFYKIPLHRGRGDTEEADRVKNVVFSYLTVATLVTGAGIALYAMAYRHTLRPGMFWGLLVVSVLLLARRIFNYYMMLLRANKDFAVLSRSIIFDAVVNLALVFFIVRRFGLKGLFAVVLIMPVLNVLFIRRFVDYDLKYSFDLNKLSSYIRFGFPLFITSILLLVLQSVDKIMIAKFIGLEALGIYSIAVMAKSYSVGVSKNFNVVITPHFLEDYGRSNDMDRAMKYLKMPAEIMSTFMAFMLGAVYLVAPVFILKILPRYIDGINALKFMLLATYFHTASPQSDHFLIAMNKQARLIPIFSSVIFMNIILNYLFIRMGYGITGVAASTALASLAGFIITLVYALSHGTGFINTVRFVMYLFVPLIFSFLAINIIGRPVFLGNAWGDAVLKLLLFFVLYTPLLYVVDKRTSVLRTMAGMIMDKVNKGRTRHER